MKKMILLFTFFVFSNTALFAQTQGEMNMDAFNSYKKVDKELGYVYNKILSKYSKNTKFVNAMRSSERLWIQFRDAEVKMMFPSDDPRKSYGSMYPLLLNSYLEELTKARINQLKLWLYPKDDNQGSIGDFDGSLSF